jgi:hypothetical protein
MTEREPIDGPLTPPFGEGYTSPTYKLAIDYDGSIEDSWDGIREQGLQDYLRGTTLDDLKRAFPDKSSGQQEIHVATLALPRLVGFGAIRNSLIASGLELPDLRTGLAFVNQYGAKFNRYRDHNSYFVTDQSPERNEARARDVLVWAMWPPEHRFYTNDFYEASRLGGLGSANALVVCNAADMGYKYEDTPLPEQPTKERAEKILIEASVLIHGSVGNPSKRTQVQSMIEGLTGHPDPDIAKEAIGIQKYAAVEGNLTASFEQIGFALGHEHPDVARYAAQTIIETTIPGEDRNPDGLILFTTAIHGDKVSDAAADLFFAKALDWIDSVPPRDWYRGGHDRGHIKSGYNVIANLAVSKDIPVARDAIGFLAVCIKGGEVLSEIDEHMSHFIEGREILSDRTEERRMWQAMKDAIASRKFTHRTTEAYSALSRVLPSIQDPSLRDLATKTAEEHKAALKEMKDRGIYMQFD